ncbi:MAG: sigma-70 family RNA polymerase sigma factor [Phycisphaeraceae bacterium]|nr:sigma-70 family RNA polymerase sigma factor [Phycisphaeraceae bacterium]
MPTEREKTSRFTVLWLKAQPVLAGYVGAMVRDRAAADDIVQGVALTAVEKMDDYDDQRSFEAWVIGIARYKVLQHYRTVGQDKLIFDEGLSDSFTKHYADAASGYEDRVDALRTCMAKLPDEAQSLLSNRYYEQVPVKSIASKLGETPARISKKLFAIRRALEQCIAQRLKTEGGPQ